MRQVSCRLDARSCTLTSFADVQIYVEIERARLTKRLAKIKEAGGDVNEAADTLQEVAVVRMLC
jgi:26S proteasome regulatory subunit N5